VAQTPERSSSREPSPRRTRLFDGLSTMGSAIKQRLLRRGDTQLEDFAQFVWNEKYKSWIPGDEDPDEWAKKNIAAPPPPPGPSGPVQPQTPSGGNPLPLQAGAPGDVGACAATPSTPMAQPPGGPQQSAGGCYSARGSSARRKPARARYVDTFNPVDDSAPDSQSMPPPPARPKPFAGAVFTPQRSAAASDTGSADDRGAGADTHGES